MKKLLYLILIVTIIFFAYSILEKQFGPREIGFKNLSVAKNQDTFVEADSVLLRDFLHYLEEKYSELEYGFQGRKKGDLKLSNSSCLTEVPDLTLNFKLGKKLIVKNAYVLKAERDSLELFFNCLSKPARKGFLEFDVVLKSGNNSKVNALTCISKNDTLDKKLVFTEKLNNGNVFQKVRYPFSLSKADHKGSKNNSYRLIVNENQLVEENSFILLNYRIFFNDRKNTAQNLLIIDYDGLRTSYESSFHLPSFLEDNLTRIDKIQYNSTKQLQNLKCLFTGLSPFEFSESYQGKSVNNYLEMINKFYRTFKLPDFLLQKDFQLNYYLPDKSSKLNVSYTSKTIIPNEINYNLTQLKELFQDYLYNLGDSNFFYLKLSAGDNNEHENERVFKILNEFSLFLKNKNLLKDLNLCIINTNPAGEFTNFPETILKVTGNKFPCFLSKGSKARISKANVYEVTRMIMQNLKFKIPAYFSDTPENDFNVIDDHERLCFQKDSLWLACSKNDSLIRENFIAKSNSQQNLDFAFDLKEEDVCFVRESDFFKEIILKNNSAKPHKIKITISSPEIFTLGDKLNEFYQSSRSRKNKMYASFELKPGETVKKIIYYRKKNQKFFYSFSNYVDIYYGSGFLSNGLNNKFTEISSLEGLSKKRYINIQKAGSDNLLIFIRNMPAYIMN